MSAVQAAEGQQMTPAHTEALLGLLVALDARLKAPDERTASLRVSAWTALLREVPPDYAMHHAERAYQEVRDWPLQPAEILQAWRTDQAEARTRAEQEYRDTHPLPVAPGAFADWVQQAMAVAAAGGDVNSIPRPPVAPLSPERDAYERRCTFWQLCACPHTDCRDGVLDDETTVVGVSGMVYAAVKRCPWCWDAVVMADEQGLAKRPSRTGGRRR